jgi:hypothetical protein
VVGSHSTNKEAERRPKRERILDPDGGVHTVDFTACAPCTAARGLAPNAGGLDVEGAAWIGDRLWLGLRSPLVDGKALLVALDAGYRVTETVPIDLGGNGVRELVPVPSGLLIVAGPVTDIKSDHVLYHLDAVGKPAVRVPVALPPSTEGAAVDPGGRLVYVTDGDGKHGECRTPATWGRVALP